MCRRLRGVGLTRGGLAVERRLALLLVVCALTPHPSPNHTGDSMDDDELFEEQASKTPRADEWRARLRRDENMSPAQRHRELRQTVTDLAAERHALKVKMSDVLDRADGRELRHHEHEILSRFDREATALTVRINAAMAEIDTLDSY